MLLSLFLFRRHYQHTDIAGQLVLCFDAHKHALATGSYFLSLIFACILFCFTFFARNSACAFHSIARRRMHNDALFSSKPQHTHTRTRGGCTFRQRLFLPTGAAALLLVLVLSGCALSLSLSDSSGIGSSSCRYSCVLLCLLLLLLLLLLLFTILLLHIKQSRVLFLCLTVDAVLFPKGARVGDDCSSVAPCCCLAG